MCLEGMLVEPALFWEPKDHILHQDGTMNQRSLLSSAASVVVILLVFLEFVGRILADTPKAHGSQNPSILTKVERVRRLSFEQANLGHPVCLRGVVTYSGGTGWDFFIQDETGGIYIDFKESMRSIKAGQFVEVVGVTEGGYAPMISQPKIHVLGQAPMPKAKETTFENLMSGREDSQWVEI